MIGRVSEEHGGGEPRLLDRVAVHRFEEAFEAGSAEARIAQHHHAVVVAREYPEAERTLVDRVGLAQAVVEGIRVSVELGQERVEQHLGRCHGSRW